MKSILRKVERRYKVRFPKQVVMVDYGERDDLYIRFKNVDKPLGEPSEDFKVIFFYDRNKIVALEIRDVKDFT